MLKGQAPKSQALELRERRQIRDSERTFGLQGGGTLKKRGKTSMASLGVGL